jgi:hypothetical protein
LRATTVLDFDSLGILSALGAAITAIAELKKHRTNAIAYSIAAQELGVAETLLSAIDNDESWGHFVSDTEDAISREHTMWQARHGRTPSST